MKALLFLVVTLFLAQVSRAQNQTPVASNHPKNLLETIDEDGSLSFFGRVVRAAGMAEKLKSSDHMTVLAFDDRALLKLPPDLRQSLVEHPQLFGPLLLHYVIPRDVNSQNLERKALTLDGLKLRVEQREGTLRVQNAKVTRSDITASNGVIHVLD
jgi:uncharacterized surface protein with fasciclin (FAS1) repeats